MTPGDIRELAGQIRYVAERYERVAEQMEQRGISSMLVGGVDTTKNANIPRLSGNASTLERALLSAKPDQAKLKVAENDQDYLEKMADDAERKAIRRRKKKGG